MTRALRRAFAVLIVGAVLGGTAACAKRTVYGEGTPTIDARPGRDIVIALPSDPTTGHEWRIGGLPDPRVAALLRADFEGTPGAGSSTAGNQLWIFRAVAAGTTTLRLDYGRPWTAPLRSVTFTIGVR